LPDLAVRFMERSLQAATADELLDQFCAAIAERGYDRLGWHRDGPVALMRGWPDGWPAYFAGLAATGEDPMLNRLLADARRPLVLSEMTRLTPAERRHMGVVAESGVRDVAVFPIRLVTGQKRLISICTSSPDVSPRRDLKGLYLTALQLHTRHVMLTAPKEAAVRLTPREHDILAWSLQGKSKWAMGEILGITEHGVDFHLRNIYRKLGVTSRVHAVAKAVSLGLLAP
jgi:DNA-binding CsgD family transcriptional regulator